MQKKSDDVLACINARHSRVCSESANGIDVRISVNFWTQ